MEYENIEMLEDDEIMEIDFDYLEGWENMPCEYTGYCSTSCPIYYKCALEL